MSLNIALVVEPDWTLLFPPFRWDDPNYQTSPRAQWFYRIRTHVSQISQVPADLILTPAMPDNPLDALFSEPQQPNPNYAWQLPYQLLPTTQHHPTKLLWERLKTFKIMSRQFTTNPTKKQPVAQPIPGTAPISTQYGLINANAHNDAIHRILTNTRYKIDHLVILDPAGRVNSGIRRIPPDVEYEVAYADRLHKTLNANYPVTVIT